MVLRNSSVSSGDAKSALLCLHGKMAVEVVFEYLWRHGIGGNTPTACNGNHFTLCVVNEGAKVVLGLYGWNGEYGDFM